MECLSDMEDRMFRIIVILSETEGFKTKVSCDKYAKFLINEFSGLKNKLCDGLYNSVDPIKLKALFSISEQFGWFTRKDIIDFLEYNYKRPTP